MTHRRLFTVIPALALACGTTNEDMTTDTEATSEASSGEAPTTGEEGTTAGETGGDEEGQSFPDPEDAPTYAGEAFSGMQIYDVARDVWLDEAALMSALDPAKMVFIGEQHMIAPTHELELWVLTRMLARHDDVALGMEQFQRDEQAVIDDYLAGTIDAAGFVAASQPWEGYTTYWRPLVEAMKEAGRPVLGLNVPDEALDSLYAAFPMSPLAVFNDWGADAMYDEDLPPRPLAQWDAAYQEYFAGSYDYESHGKDWGLTYEEALAYFTDLALIRDDTMGWWIAQQLEVGEGRVVVVAGDWHVQTGLATPDSAAKFVDAEIRRITTATPGTLETVLAVGTEERPVADFVLVYTL